jgi:GGDEF domain-containing protein
MSDLNAGRPALDDPRRLREMLTRATGLAAEHSLTSVLVGVTGFEGDLLFPEVLNFIESSMRMDDLVFRMTRERAVLLLTDVDERQAHAVMRRLLEDFREHFPAANDPAIALAYFEVADPTPPPTAKDVLPRLFERTPKAH